MREIKFRAWVKDFDPSIFSEDDTPTGIMREVRQIEFPCRLHDDTVIWLQQGFKSENYVLTQFTGLKDKNGKEIYEGDILLHDDTNWGYGGEYDRSHDGYLRYVVPGIDELLKETYDAELMESWEVIGNAHENPELLEKGR